MSLINNLVEQLINGLRTGSIYALIALGYTMVYGIAKMINFAHGDIIMVGAYALYVFAALLGLPVPVCIILTIIVCAVLGIVVERIVYKPLRNAHMHLPYSYFRNYDRYFDRDGYRYGGSDLVYQQNTGGGRYESRIRG